MAQEDPRPPWKVGDEIAVFQLSGNQVKVFGSSVEGITPRGEGWRITNSRGQWLDVPTGGVTGEVQRMDDFIRHELKTKGQGFVAVESLIDMEQELPEPTLEQELDGGRDGI
jgi:hypothetical protein